MRKQGEYRVTANARSLRQNMTKAEVILWVNIRKRALHGARLRRQHPNGPASKLIVEVDGHTHWTQEELAYDARRTTYLEQQGWTVLRVTNTDVYDNMDGVWCAIAAQRALPAPPACAGVRDLPASGED